MGRGGEQLMTDDLAFFKAREQKATARLKELRREVPKMVQSANAELMAERDALAAAKRLLQSELKAMRGACAERDEKLAQMQWRVAQQPAAGGKRGALRPRGQQMADVAVAAQDDAQAMKALGIELPAAAPASAIQRPGSAQAAGGGRAKKAWSSSPPTQAISGSSRRSHPYANDVEDVTANMADLVPSITAKWRALKDFAATEASAMEPTLDALIVRVQDPDYRKRIWDATCTDKAFTFSSPDAWQDVTRAAGSGSALVVVRHVLEAMGRGKGIALLRLYQGEIDTLMQRGGKATKAHSALLQKVKELDHAAGRSGGDALEAALNGAGGGAALLAAKKEIRQLREAVLGAQRVTAERGERAAHEKQSLVDENENLRRELKRVKEKMAYLKRRGGIEVPRPALRGAAARGAESVDVAAVGPSGRIDEAKGQALALVEARGRLQQWQARSASSEQNLAATETSLLRQTKLLEESRRELKALHDVAEVRETAQQQNVIGLRGELVGARMQVSHFLIYQSPACSTDPLTILTAVQSKRAYVRAQERYRTKQSTTQTTTETETEPCANKMCQTVEDWPQPASLHHRRGGHPDEPLEPRRRSSTRWKSTA